MATNYTTSFTVTKADLEFMLKQIKIAEATSAAHTPVGTKTTIQAIMDAFGVTAANAAQMPAGLRTVDGTDNNLIPGQSTFGAADQLFPRLTDPVFRNDADGDQMPLGGPTVITNTNYGLPGVSVADADPRIISNLIVDMSVNNPAAIEAWFNNPLSVAAWEEANPGMVPVAPTDPLAGTLNYVAITNTDLQTIPNQSPDIGLSPGFNSWMTFFGQFFDHGLDLVTKGNSGTVYIPLQADDPLIAGADGAFGTLDDLAPHLRFMALTRATVTLDANGVPQHENTTTSWIDQNQTYTSHASHQVFLREYVRVETSPGVFTTLSTGKLLTGPGGTIGNWGQVKEEALSKLGLILSDFDVHNVPLLRTDQYGELILGANGYAQVATLAGFVEGTAAGLDLSTLVGIQYTNHAFLNDIAHHAAPSIVDVDEFGVRDGIKSTVQVSDADIDANGNGVYDVGIDTLTDVNGDGVVTTADFFAADKNLDGSLNDLTYDDEMLESHFVTGDGRGNENIALTTVHSIFHSEHDRLVDVNKATILASGDLAFINEWLRVDIASLADIATPEQKAALTANLAAWDGERLFQAARFATEMQYQHLVFEEFARRIQPMVDPFIFNSVTEIDPSIVAEFAHTVYRFGHSMLTGTVDRLENDLTTVNGEPDQKTLLAVFLNPQEYIASGTDAATINANLIRGLSRDVGNALDEFIVTDVRSNLLGLPLDLAVLNIARGRDTGIPSLNQTRAQLYNDSGLADLKPYESWADFAANIKNPMSIINFIAAYGTHATIDAALTLVDKRAAAVALINAAIAVVPDADAYDFIHGLGAYTGNLGGLNLVDLWIGGLAEANPEFGGMLGTTFNFVFEYQMEALQFGDRLYYLTRTQGTGFLNQLEPNTFSDLVMRNTELGDIYSTHLNGALFVTPDHILELDRGIAQTDYDAGAGIDPTWAPGEPHSVLTPLKVTRTYSGATVVDDMGTPLDLFDDVIHDFGGTLRYIGGEHVVLGGTEGNDKLYGDRGIDTLWGDGGNDYLNGGTESDDVFGGEGDDIIEDPFGDDVLRGNQGNDVISSARGADLLFGDEGTDVIMLGQDASEVFAGTGDDFVLGGAGKDFLLGNEGADWIEGGAGFDTIAGDNSELFFNSPIQGHDVLFGQGDETDYDAESGDDIMGAGPSVFRYEGMFGFDWAIGKGDLSPDGVNFDFQIPIFTTIPNDILKDRFDQVEAASGGQYDDFLQGDDRGHKGGGSSAPDSVPTELFTDHVLTAEGIARINGLAEWMAGARTTLFGSVPGANATSYRDGNILMGGDGNDAIRGRGGYDLIDGDAYLNVRIKIVHNGFTYSAESLSSDVTAMGPNAGKVFNTNPDGTPNFASPAFGGVSLTSLLLNGTINPGSMSIVREILTDATPDNNIDTAFFQGTYAEYDIEGRGSILYQTDADGNIVDVNGDMVISDADGTVQAAYDLNGDGFISVRDRDTGAVGATVNGVVLSSRGALTDDLDLLKNIEQLQFADQIVVIGGPNNQATGTVTIGDPTPYDGEVTPYVGQVLIPTLSAFADLDGIPLGSNGLPVGLQFEWQTTEVGNNAGWSTIIINDGPYTVRSVDPGHVLRAVATFKDANGITERIYSSPTGNPTVALNVNENAPTNTVVLASIPFSVDYDSLSQNGLPPVDVDLATLWHEIDPANTSGGRFNVLQNGFDANGNPIFQVVVANGGPVLLDYETQDAFQIVDNQYQIVINSYSDNPANGGLLLASRQFTIFLNNIVDEGTPSNIVWNGLRPGNSTLPPTDGAVLANLSTIDASLGDSHQYTLQAGSSAGFAVSSTGAVTATAQMLPNTTYTLIIRSTDLSGAFINETFTIRTGANGVQNVIGGVVTDDVMYGLTGSDTLNGGAGDDTLFGQAGNDILDGGIGNDLLIGGLGNDTMNGGIGNDTFLYRFGDRSDTINGGADTDTLTITGINANEILDVDFDGTSITQIEGGGSILNVEIITADLLGADDTLRYTDTTANVTVNLGAGLASGFLSIANISNATGGGGNDSLTGTTGVNTLNGGNGNDTLVATVDNVRDFFNGQGGGGDTADYSAYSASLTVTIGGGNFLVGGSGTVALNFDQLNGIENFIGGSAGDTITGNGNANALNGGGGVDIITGAGGADRLTGGANNDTFDFNAIGDSGINAATRDIITDFATGDIIDLGTIGGAAVFTFIGTGAITASAVNQLRYQQIDTDGVGGVDSTIIQLDNDGDTGIESSILLQSYLGVVAATDFIL